MMDNLSEDEEKKEEILQSFEIKDWELFIN
jgi:hypothetical protein